MNNAFLDVLNKSEQFLEIASIMETDKGAVNVVGVADAQKAHVIASLLSKTGKRACIVSWSDSSARKLSEDLSFFCKKITFIPQGDFIPGEIESMSYDIKADRVRAIDEIITGNTAVMGPAAFLAFVMDKNKFSSNKMKISIGDEFTNIPDRLTNLGYKRVTVIEGEGQFCVRGGIVDIFPPTADNPYRIELFGDEVDTIRVFDVITQISEENVSECVISSADPDMGEGSIIDYFDDNSIFIFDEPSKVSDGVANFEKSADEKIADFILRGKATQNKEYFCDYKKILKKIKTGNVLGVSALSHASPDYKPQKTITLTAQTLPSYAGKMSLLLEDAQLWIKKKYKIFVFAGNASRAEAIRKAFFENGNSCEKMSEDKEPVPGVVTVYDNPLNKGFIYPHINTVFVSGSDVFTHHDKRKRIKTDGAKEIRSFDELKPGEFVVHRIHGIGKFEQLVTIETQGVNRDYLKISYKNNDCLYVPVNQLNLIYKYSHAGSDAPAPRLNKLGGSEWTKTKSNVRTSVKELAIKLIELYAERSRISGHAFMKDTPWQMEFESEFIYDETPDQIACIEDVKRDMEKESPMDRLLCGDVGYGKTEVAIRAAFKCVMDGYQCAYLVPTTILASQHYNHFAERMKNFPVEVEMLSRFRTETQQKKITDKLKSGEIDIIIGTHKLLSDKVNFKKLGLLIIDEEQRFGVGHKEKIKNMKRGVDVLTLTATPIPRTLNMAMTGIRDMSVISHPPKDRHPIQTYVLEYDELIIKDAIERELARNGQVYYVYNRVSGIYGRAKYIQDLMGDGVRVGVAHGRMNEEELENIMMKTLNGEIDVLVCTTIIETGIDIQNVNTMIIENADNMGLAQLYQLRGRVGRSNRIAYAYLTFRRDKMLSEVAEKRLIAIKEFTELGSGFKIALRDLEIRGAGNLLGPEQHGFMASVGYDMYIRLLNETVNEMSGKAEENIEVLIDINIEARIPESYIEDSTLRLEAYRMIADIENEQEASLVLDRLADRYGDIPDCVGTLVDVAMLRNEAGKAGITDIAQKGENIVLSFEKTPDLKGIADVMGEYKGKILFGAGEKPYLSLRQSFGRGKTLAKDIRKLVTKLITPQ